jgi:glycosyltransferase involved in cell wall biosynthesis
MKLLMISGDRLTLQGKRGSFWYTLDEMKKHWDRIDVICPRVPGAGKKMLHDTDGSLHDIELDGKVFFHPSPWGLLSQSRWIAKRGAELITEHKHDVMTVHEYPPFYNGIGAKKLFRKFSIPYALEIHHIVGTPKAANIIEWVGHILSRFYLRLDARSSKVVRAVNLIVQERLVSWGIPKEKVEVVPSFYLDETVLRPDLAPPKSYDVSFCGRLVANKGLQEVIQAINELPGISLLIIGDGPERASCEALAEKFGIEDRVTFLGWIPTLEGVIGAIQTARIYVMNSTSEGGPRTALEAMACGMPVIVTPVGVMPEVIQDGVNGVFSDGTVSDLKQKILSLLKDEDFRERLGKDAQNVLDRFNRSVLIKKYAEFLQSLP